MSSKSNVLGALVLGVGDETGTLVTLGGDSGDGIDLVGTSILVRSLLPLLGQGGGSLVTCCMYVYACRRGWERDGQEEGI